MGMLDWSFVSLLSAALLFLFFGIISLLGFLLTGRKRKPFKRRPPKNKKKRKRFLRQRAQLNKQWRRQRTQFIVFILVAAASSGGAYYTRYYQQNHLMGEDNQAIAQSYYLLDELSRQLEIFQQGENPKKTMGNIKELSGRLTSFGSRHAAITLSEKNQRALNRYYNALRELGVNLYSQTEESLNDPLTTEGYTEDILKAQTNQSEIFKRFKVNESALKNKK